MTLFFRSKARQEEEKILGGITIPKELSGLNFIHIEGRDSGKKLMLLALSTCGFCRKAIQFMDDRGVEYVYIYTDKLSIAHRGAVRKYVSQKFSTSLSFPFLVIDYQRWISGFLRIEWEELIPDENN